MAAQGICLPLVLVGLSIPQHEKAGGFTHTKKDALIKGLGAVAWGESVIDSE